MFADLVPGTGSGRAVGRRCRPRSMPAALLAALDRYPFGCSEQIASRALPLLYVNELASAAQLALDTAVDQRIRDAIDRLLARQGSNGSFGLWSVGRRGRVARRLCHRFPDAGARARLRRARRGVQAGARPAAQFRRQCAEIPPRTAAASSPMRSMCWRATARRRSATCAISPTAKLDAIATPIAKAQIAAALAMLGDRARAERVYAAALAAIAPQPGARATAAPTTARCCAMRRRW